MSEPYRDDSWDEPMRSTYYPEPTPMRVQICRGGLLFAEAIVEPEMVDTFSPHNVFARLGGVVIQRADRPRTWDVPVGSPIAGASAGRRTA
jgi:hypothetical protein